MKTNKESILTTNLRHPRNPKLVLSGSEFWLLNAQDIQTPVGLETLRGGAAMVLNVPTGMLDIVQRDGGVLMRAGLKSAGLMDILLITMKAGDYLAVAMCDLADPTVKAFTHESIRAGAMQLLMLEGSRQTLTMHRMDEPLKAGLIGDGNRRLTDSQTYIAAVRSTIRDLSDEVELARMGLDSLRLRQAVLSIHMPDAVAHELAEDILGSSEDETLH